MKIGIVGAGAMGSMFAHFFLKNGIETALFEKDEDTIAELKKGLTVIIDENREICKVEIDNTAEILRGCGAVFIFVKSYSTGTAIKEIAGMIDKDCFVVTLQNGIGNKEVISANIPEEKIVYGSTSIGAAKIDKKTVRLGGMGGNVIGGSNEKAVNYVEEILKKAGLDVTVTKEPEIAIWKKAIVNAGINPIGAMLSIPNGKIIENEYSKLLQEKIAREAVNVAEAMGVKLDPDEMVEMTRTVCQKTAKNLCSMLQDVSAKRKTEIDSINGIIIKYGGQRNIETPYNQSMYNLIKAKELY